LFCIGLQGYQYKQIARLLADNEIAEYDEILQLIQEENEFREGYLFPDTYGFPKNFGAANVLRVIRDNFEKIVYQHIKPEQEFPADLDFNQVMILASIVEKEAQGKEDKPKIASVFYNRLKAGMRLQSCATIQYLLEKPQQNLTQQDLQIESPFNTYIYSGLPPEPICNPGLDSILAAAKMENTYFLKHIKNILIINHKIVRVCSKILWNSWGRFFRFQLSVFRLACGLNNILHFFFFIGLADQE